MKASKSALVAGGAGFIGSHLVRFLLNKNYRVVVVDNLVTGQMRNIESIRNLVVGQDGANFEFVEANIIDPLPSAIENQEFDEIYNLASPASPVDFGRIPLFILETASVGHRRLLDLAEKCGARILFASSSEVYGDAEVHPQTEGYFGNVNCFGPRSCYDEAKRVGETLNYIYKEQKSLQVRTARIFNTYGPSMRPSDGRIIPNFFMQALQGEALTIYGDGSQTRSFCYVSDLVEGLFALMQSQESRPVNLGNPIERSVLEIANTVRTLTRSDVELKYLPLPENDPKVRRPNITRASESFQWTPKVSLEEGLAQTLTYFKECVASQSFN